MSDLDVVGQNREYWNHLASHRHGEPVEFFRDGGSALTPEETAAIGDVEGRRVLQLACAVGDEALTFAQRGATVTAVDLAPAHLATGRAKARTLWLADHRTLMRIIGVAATAAITIHWPEPAAPHGPMHALRKRVLLRLGRR